MVSLADSLDPIQPAHRGWSISLWVAQVALAALYAFSGVLNTFLSPDELVAMKMSHASVLPLGWVRFIGATELLGAAGVVLPAALRIRPSLTPLAALGFVALQGCAIAYHLLQGEYFILPVNATLTALAVFVWWGRTRKVPVLPR